MTDTQGESAMKTRLRVGVAGAGWWAVENHLPLLRDDPRAEIVAVCRPGAAELERVRSAFDIPVATEDFDDMLDRGGMDAIVIVSPHAVQRLAISCGRSLGQVKSPAWMGCASRAGASALATSSSPRDRRARARRARDRRVA